MPSRRSSSAASYLLMLTPKGGTPPPANTVAPSHDGTSSAVIGTEINGTVGTWSGDPTLTHQWQRSADGSTGWADIGSATALDYTPVDADFGYYLRRAETGTNAAGAVTAYTANTARVLITGLALWLDASDAATLFQDSAGTTPATADADPIGKWADKSGNGKHVTQGTTANKPTLKLAIKNGLPVVRFDGGDVLSSALVTASTAWTVIVAAEVRTGSNRTLIFNGTDGGGGDGWAVGSGFNVASKRTVFLRGVAFCEDGTIGGTAWELWAGSRASGGAISFRLNGASESTTPSSGAQATPTTSTFIGGADATPAFPLTGDIAEIMVYSSALSTENIEAIEDYLNAKWAVY